MRAAGVSGGSDNGVVYIVVELMSAGDADPSAPCVRAVPCQVDPVSGQVHADAPVVLSAADCVAWVTDREIDRPRWVWADTSVVYDFLLARGVWVAKCHDLRLSRAILSRAAWVDSSVFRAPSSQAEQGAQELAWWDGPTPVAARQDVLFDESHSEVTPDCVAELERQMRVLRTAGNGRRQRLSFLMALESAGALIAREMYAVGVPWDRDHHEALLREQLGERPAVGVRPAALEAVAQELRRLLDAPELNPDSPKDLLRALNSAGIPVTTTSKWALREHRHPALAPLERYKHLARLWTAHGWAWLDEWVSDGRYRPVYTPGGVVTGRWGADGGGALQLPRAIRGAARAGDGFTFVIADASQLEPRVLAAMSGDAAMAEAGRGGDMYQRIADAGVVPSREHAKYGMLGAMYGGTTGVSAQVLPQFRQAFPTAMAMVESAARVGERGGQVTTWLGRTSPPGVVSHPDESDDADVARERRLRSRSYGRFTRNFIVQGSAAEWAMAWMVEIRLRLHQLSLGDPTLSAPSLVFFLHDEVLIHTPVEWAETVAEVVRVSARQAGETLFPGSVVEFPVKVLVNDSYTDPKVVSQGVGESHGDLADHAP